MTNVRTHTLLVQRNTASHTRRVVAVGSKQQNINNINVEHYGNVRTKGHGLESKNGVCCRGKVVGHEHHQSWKISEALP